MSPQQPTADEEETVDPAQTEEVLTFEALEFTPHSIGAGGVAARAYYPNGYGVSVIRFEGSYGWKHGLYELAVLEDREDGWEICYTTPITNDVEGYLSPEKVTELMQAVAALPAKAA